MKFFDKAAIAVGLKEAPRRRGLGKKNPLRIAQEAVKSGERALVLVPDRKPSLKVVAGTELVRNYKEVSATDGINSDWAISAISQDADVWQNNFALRQRSRHLFDTDVYFQKYTEELFANVFGWNGYSLRMRIKETEDRVVYAPDEKGYLEGWQRRWDRVAEYVERKYGQRTLRKRTFIRALDRELQREFGDRASAQVQVGDLDVYAIKIIQDAFKEWQRREYCTVTKTLEYNETRNLRLLSAARDGDFFIRLVKDPRINKFGFALQFINGEWCDYFLNVAADQTKNGNEIRMGVELDAKWKFPVAYWFIKRQPMDWQFSTPGAFNFAQGELHERIPAEEIIHYARRRYADSTRPAPWSASVIPKSRHLDKYEESEVVAARVAAMKMGFFKSTVDPTGGTSVGEKADPTQAATLEAEPGSFQGLPWGVEFQGWEPNHPNGNFDLFRKGMLRAWCAGLPGANYNIIANDLEGVNYSSGRLGMLDERELWKLIQKFDIDIAEIPIFEAFLEMALMTGAIPLPLAKFKKFNQPIFRGRRWAWVDPLKEIEANALAIANKLTSRTRVIEDSDIDADFEEILFEQSEEQMMADELGMDLNPVTGKSPQSPDGQNAEDADVQNEPDGTIKALSDERLRELLGCSPAQAQQIGINNQNHMKLLDVITLIRAMQPQQALSIPQPERSITVNVPPIQLTAPEIDLSKLKIPEQKAPIVNVASAKVIVPEIRMPEVAPTPLIVNVAAPEVKIDNKVNVPAASKIKVGRDKDGKMTHAEIERQ